MKVYKYFDSPLEVHGLPFWENNHKLERIPDEDIGKFPLLSFLGKRCPGARVCFRTDSPSFIVRIKFETLSFDIGMSVYDCQSVNVMIGERKNARFAGIVFPENYETKVAEKTFHKSSAMEDITLFLPRNEIIADFEVELEDGAQVAAPTPYKFSPMLYYGSSVTEGGCCCRITNAYNALISSSLDVDYYNFGFSGSARGELEMADLINRIPMSVFVYDYDYNAPTVEHLKKTHEPFFKRIREKNPDLPVIMLSHPTYQPSEEADQRAAIIYTTYQNALKAGDQKVWFIDGRTFFGEEASKCSCDDCHPNDLGFYFMAKAIEPTVKEALEKAENHGLAL